MLVASVLVLESADTLVAHSLHLGLFFFLLGSDSAAILSQGYWSKLIVDFDSLIRIEVPDNYFRLVQTCG